MKSNISLYVEIEHEDNLDLDSNEIVAEIANHLATALGVESTGPIESIRSGRRTVSGGVTVTLNSAAITSQRPAFDPLCVVCGLPFPADAPWTSEPVEHECHA